MRSNVELTNLPWQNAAYQKRFAGAGAGKRTRFAIENRRHPDLCDDLTGQGVCRRKTENDTEAKRRCRESIKPVAGRRLFARVRTVSNVNWFNDVVCNDCNYFIP